MMNSLAKKLGAPIRAVGELVVPGLCWVEGEMLAEAGGLSGEARRGFDRHAAQGYCHFCGLTVAEGPREFLRLPCMRCGERRAQVKRIARVGTFHEPLVTLVHRFKFGRRWELAGMLSEALARAMGEVSELHGVPVEVMVPVPLHWWRLGERGFNQAELLAKGISRVTGWEVVEGLKRKRATQAQAMLAGAPARRRNLRGAFVARATGALAGRHVWLIDDVSTTGATLGAAAWALRRMPRELRPASVSAGVVCVVDRGSPVPE